MNKFNHFSKEAVMKRMFYEVSKMPFISLGEASKYLLHLGYNINILRELEHCNIVSKPIFNTQTGKHFRIVSEVNNTGLVIQDNIESENNIYLTHKGLFKILDYAIKYEHNHD